ncbi:MAG TPA: SemiSWEET transporter [Hyphomicrobiales bacterium]|nr:SemiSWEET transporter [Hyphomicrobiales bacterium]
MIPHELLGTAAGFCTTIATLPQLRQTWRSRHVENVSLRTFLILFIGLGLWTAYGISLRDWPIIVTNGISCLLNGAMVLLLLLYRRKGVQANRHDAGEKPSDAATRRPPRT